MQTVQSDTIREAVLGGIKGVLCPLQWGGEIADEGELQEEQKGTDGAEKQLIRFLDVIMKKEEEDPHPPCSEENKSFSGIFPGVLDVIIKKEDDEELWAFDPLVSVESKISPASCSGLSSPKVNETSWFKEEKPGVPGHPVVQQNEIASDTNTGLPDVIIKVEEEELNFLENHQELGNEESAAVAVSGNGLRSKNLHLCISEKVGPNGPSLGRIKGFISKCHERGKTLDGQDGVERQPQIHHEISVEKIPLWGEEGMAQDETDICKRIHKCEKIFVWDPSLLAHVREKLHTCIECGKSFREKSSLVRHRRTHTGEKPHTCAECGKCFSLKSSLVRHQRTHACEKGGNGLGVHKGTHVRKEPYRCYTCGKTFRNKAHFIIHERTHTGEKPFQCHDCGKSFRNSSHLILHKRTHTGEKPYKCSICGKSFNQSSNLIRHVRTHTGEKPYSCSVCGKSFSWGPELQIHERIHTGEKPYKCTECEKSFSNYSSFIRHKRIHTGEKPYQCSDCSKSFHQSSDLRAHERSHHQSKSFWEDFGNGLHPVEDKRMHTEVKLYKCSACGKSFSRRSHLTRHMRTHMGEKPYKCSHCGKSFNQTSNLIRHERTHTGEKPYNCTSCNKSFNRKSHLIRHQRTHVGEKPYNCSDCGKSLNQRSKLLQHEESHVEEKSQLFPQCGESMSFAAHQKKCVHCPNKDT